MGLIKKFNLIFSAIFLIGLLSTGYLFYMTEMIKAKDTAILEAELIIETAFASRKYTYEEIEPLFTQHIYGSEDNFFPQVIPVYAANRIFEIIRDKYPEYTYREVASNPKNLNNLPSSWEVEIIRYYRSNPEAKKMIYNRMIDGKELLYITYGNL